MSSALRIAGMVVVGLIALWLVLEIVGFVFGVVSTIVSLALSLLVLAAIVAVGYVIVSTVLT